jgi:hypothetical protein
MPKNEDHKRTEKDGLSLPVPFEEAVADHLKVKKPEGKSQAQEDPIAGAQEAERGPSGLVDRVAMRETWRIRAFIVGLGVFLLAGSYLVLIPDLPPKERAWVYAAVPVSFSLGLVVSVAALLLERRHPEWFARITPASLALPSSALLGFLIFIADAWMLILAAAMAGATVPAATPLARFQPPKKRD